MSDIFGLGQFWSMSAENYRTETMKEQMEKQMEMQSAMQNMMVANNDKMIELYEKFTPEILGQQRLQDARNYLMQMQSLDSANTNMYNHEITVNRYMSMQNQLQRNQLKLSEKAQDESFLLYLREQEMRSNAVKAAYGGDYEPLPTDLAEKIASRLGETDPTKEVLPGDSLKDYQSVQQAAATQDALTTAFYGLRAPTKYGSFANLPQGDQTGPTDFSSLDKDLETLLDQKPPDPIKTERKEDTKNFWAVLQSAFTPPKDDGS